MKDGKIFKNDLVLKGEVLKDQAGPRR